MYSLIYLHPKHRHRTIYQRIRQIKHQVTDRLANDGAVTIRTYRMNFLVTICISKRLPKCFEHIVMR